MDHEALTSDEEASALLRKLSTFQTFSYVWILCGEKVVEEVTSSRICSSLFSLRK